MKKLWVIISATCLLAMTACNQDESVMLRVKNVSNFTLKQVRVGNDSIGNLAPGEYTDYKTYPYAYSYNSYSFIANNDTIRMTAIDYVGESHLKAGKYTYELNYEQNTDSIFIPTLTCVSDN